MALPDTIRRGVEFSVIDVETTGLYPGSSDRIVEIAIIRATTRGEVIDEYCTLVNPERDIGPTSIHGIKSEDVVSAPRFKDIAGDVADQIAELTVIGHNVRFDMAFLQSEYRRIGAALPVGSTLSTLDLALRASIPASSRRLNACCEALGIPHEDSHTAIGDARATTHLFLELANLFGRGYLRPLGKRGPRISPEVLARLTRSGRTWTREFATVERQEAHGYLSRLVSNMPLASPAFIYDPDASDIVSYLDLLDRALMDRHISADEAESLAQLASEMGLTQSAVIRAHETYLGELASIALADGIVTSAERDDLESVAQWLGLSSDYLESKLRASERPEWERRESMAGKTVCFTGDSCLTVQGEPLSRFQAEQAATEVGMIVKSGVSKKLDILVVADPLSQSAKAVKARDYGTTIVAEHVFLQLLGVRTD